MAASFTLPTVLANLAAGNQPLSLIDGDLNALANPLLALQTFGNYYADGGAANAYVITVSSPQTVALAAGLPIQVLIATTNTGASTLQINALAAKNILNGDGSAMSASQLIAGGIFSLMYDGTQFRLLGITFLSSTFTATLTGCTTAPTYTVNVTKIGNAITMDIPAATGTSNATSKTLTGMPAAYRPATAKRFQFFASDVGGAYVAAILALGTDGVLTFTATANAGNWTASGVATLGNCSLAYTLT